MLDNGKEAWVDFDSYRLNRRRRILERDGVHVRLTPRVFDVLSLLVEEAGEVVTKEQLLEKVWADAVVEEGNINRTISTLRKQLGRQADGADFIETVPRVGYRFLAEVSTATKVRNELNEFDGGGTVADEKVEPGSRRSRRPFFAPVLGALAVIATVGLIGWKYWTVQPTAPAVRKNVMVKVLDTPDEELNPTFSNDGRIRFGRRFPDKSVRWFSVAEDGTDIREEKGIPNLSTGKWSPDGTKVVYAKAGDHRKLYVSSSDGSDERLLPFSGGNSAWSPDGKSFLYQALAPNSPVPNNSDIFLYNFESGDITPVVESLAFDGDPAFSPDGRSIAFVSERDGNFEVYLMDLATKEIRRMTNHPAHDSFPSFPPDGTQLLFNSDRENENTAAYLMNLDGSGLRRITDGPTYNGAPPDCWSSDGTKILLISDRDGDEDIFVMTVEPYAPEKLFDVSGPGPASPSYTPDGGAVVYQERDGNDSQIRIFDVARKASRHLTAVSGFEALPSLSPDGQIVAFQEKIDDNTEVMLIRMDGTGRVNLSQNHAKDVHPTFSPDGKTIAFSANRAGSSSFHELYVMNIDGSDQHMVYGDRATSVTPVYSPDGRLLFFANDREEGRIGNFELFAMPVTGGTVTRLTNRRRADVQPSVSPDGKRIVFSSTTDGNSEIYLMNIDGSGVVRLTRDPSDDNTPRWSPDGRSIIFSSDRGGKTGVYTITL
jgi:Tol biopolymer transport system component/DNA-binding winged helix-turn-helix (wHTH) protein